MHQERTGGTSQNTAIDTAILVVLVVVIVFARRIFYALSSFSAPWNTVARIAIFVLLGGVCYYYYEMRVRDFRYSFILRRPEGEPDEAAAGAWAPGTVLFESVSGKKKRLLAVMKPAQFVALLAPGETYEPGVGFLRTQRFAGAFARGLHTLVYREGEKLCAVRFLPSGELLALLRDEFGADAVH